MILDFVAIFIAKFVGHHIGDHWVQSSYQAQNKTEQPLERLKHVLTLQLTKAVCLIPLFFMGLSVHPIAIIGALMFDGLTHYWIDNRNNLKKLAKLFGKEGFYEAGVQPVGTGAYQLDQSAHLLFIFVVSLMLAIFG